MSAARAASVASWIFLAACLAHAGANLIFVARYWWPLPFADQQLWIEALYQQGPWYALTRHLNEHRPVVPAFFYLVDWYLFQGRQAMLEVVVVAAQAGTFFYLVRPFLSGAIPPPAARMMIAIAAVWSTWLLQCENLCWPFEINFTLGNLSLIAAAWHGSRAWIAPAAASWTGALRQAIPAALWATVGTFSLGNSALAWPLLAGFSLLERRGKLASIFTIAGAAVLLLHGAGHKPPAAGSIRPHPFDVVNFALAFWARPAAPAWLFRSLRGQLHGNVRFSEMPWLWMVAAVIGALLFFFAFRYLLRRGRHRHTLFYLPLAIAIAVTGLLAGFTRAIYGVEVAFVSRYVTVQWTLWFCLLALVTLAVFRSPRAPVIAFWAAAVVALALHTLPANAEMGAFCRERSVAMEQQAFAVRNGVFDEYAWSFIVFDAPRFRSSLDAMQRDGKNLFATALHTRFGEKLGNFEEAACDGAILGLRSIPTASGVARAVNGWAWNRAESREVEAIMLASPDDRSIIGSGLPGTMLIDQPAITADRAKWNVGFMAHTRSAPVAEPFQVWARLGGYRYCKIGPVQP
ncbi:MAG: hypothetical protein U0Q16_29790 [Bryobacteraceae bacterium]